MGDNTLTPLLAQVIDPSLPICEWEGWTWVQRCGGQARPRWRASALQALAQGVCVAASEDPVGDGWQQILVHASPQRQAFLRACQRAWLALPLGGRLILAGPNRFGLRASGRRLAKEWQHEIAQELSGKHGRVMLLHKTEDQPLATLPWLEWQDADGQLLRAPPGVFAAGRIDRGAAVLLQALDQESLSGVHSIADLGCGSGVLGLHLLRRFPQARLYAGDGDDLACAACAANAQAHLGQGGNQQVQVHWWDSREPWAGPLSDVVLCNPPWHEDGVVERSAGAAMVQQALAACAPGGVCLLVATRSQPFESLLAGHAWQECLQADGFKVLRVVGGG